jgi:hypothetical protein
MPPAAAAAGSRAAAAAPPYAAVRAAVARLPQVRAGARARAVLHVPAVAAWGRAALAARRGPVRAASQVPAPGPARAG